MLPWRTPSGLADACRFVAANTSADELVLANYWRRVIERFTGRAVPRDWLDSEARRLIEAGEITFVVLDDPDYTRQVLHTPDRTETAAWVRQAYPVVWSVEARGGRGTSVYLTKSRAPAQGRR